MNRRPLVRALLPDLDDALRAVMTGQITPAHRELMIALVQLLTDEKDIADELTPFAVADCLVTGHEPSPTAGGSRHRKSFPLARLVP